MPSPRSPTPPAHAGAGPTARRRWGFALALVALGAAAGCSNRGRGAQPEADVVDAPDTAPSVAAPGAWVRDDEAGVEVRCPKAHWRCARDPDRGAAALTRVGTRAEVFLQRIVGAKTLQEGVERLAVVGARLVNTRHVRSRKHAKGREVTFEERRPAPAPAAPDADASETDGAPGARRFWALVARRRDGAIVVCQGGAPREQFGAVSGEIQALCETMRDAPLPSPRVDRDAVAPEAPRAEPHGSPREGRSHHGDKGPGRGPGASAQASAVAACPRAAGWRCLGDLAGPAALGAPAPTTEGSPRASEEPATWAAGRVVARGPRGETVRTYRLPRATSLRAAVDAVARRAGREAGVTTLHQRRHRLGVQLDYQRSLDAAPSGVPGAARGRETVWILLRELPEGGVLVCEGAAPTAEFASAAGPMRRLCEGLSMKR